MPRGGARPGAGRPKKTPEAKAATKAESKQGFSADGKKSESTPPGWPFGTEETVEEPKPDLSGLMPLDFLLEVMRNQEEPKSLRIQAATLAAPYCHAKKGEGGKKEAKQEAAEKVAKRFQAAAPPKLVAAGGKKV